MSIEFTQPAWLLLLIAIPLVWMWPRPIRDLRHGALRSVVLALIIVGLARPTTTGRDTIEHHVVLLDATVSSVEEVTDATTEIASLRRRLGGEHTTLISLSSSESPSNENSPWGESIHLRSEGSPLGSALTAAGAAIPSGAIGAITMVSDGHSTERDWGSAVASLVARQIPVHVVPLAGPSNSDLRPVAMSIEQPVRVGMTTRATVELIGEARARVRLLTLAEDGTALVLAENDEVEVRGRATVSLAFEAKEPGFLPLQVEVEPLDGGDSDSLTNTLTTEIAVDDPLRVLYLGERVVEGGPKLEQLIGGGFSFESRGVLEDPLPDLDGFDLVMLDDRPAETVPESFQEAIADAVRSQGLGLVMTGGGGSFGPGGYHESPLASTLPVEFVQKEEKKDPSTALAIIIDTSGSMAGNRITLAKEVSRLAIRRLLPHDKIGIVEFYGTKHWAAPLQSAANAIDIQRALNRLDAGGGTILLPAIEEAYYGLRNAQTRYKHVLVLTDAGVETGPYESLLRRMARDGICVSTVLVGPPRHGEFLVQLADWGNGRFYNASDRFNLPEVMLKQPSTARLPAYRPGNHAVEPRGGEGWWGDVDPTGVPSVAGYVESRARPGAEVVLRTREEGHPVLASWRPGLGRATTLLTEPVGPGTAGWGDWSEYGAFLARVLTRTASDTLGPYRFRLEEDGIVLRIVAERRQLRVDAPEGIHWLAPGSPENLFFEERAPGVYTATIRRDRAKSVQIEAGVAGSRHHTRLVSPAHASVSPEGQVDPATALDLRALSTATGGRVVPVAELSSFLPPVGGGSMPIGVRELAPLCFFLGLLVYLAEIFYRRSRFHRGTEAMPTEAMPTETLRMEAVR